MSLLSSITLLAAILLVVFLALRLAKNKARSNAGPVTIPEDPVTKHPITHPQHSPKNDCLVNTPPSTGTQVELRHFLLQVHGIYHRNRDGSSRQQIIRNCHAGEVLRLVPEPDNPYDQDAIKVCRENGDQLGYLDAGNAMRITGELSIGWTFRVTVDEVFAADRRGCFGCRIRIGVLTMSARTEARRKKKSAKGGVGMPDVET